MKILVLNCGSSSLKYQLIDMDTENIILKGNFERIGEKESFLTHKIDDKKYVINESVNNHDEAFQIIIKQILDSKYEVYLNSLDEIDAVGHRIVHGGELFDKSVLIDDEVIKKIDACSALAPLHNPAAILGIKASMKEMPNIKMVATFDTAFHQTIPEENYLYPIPYKYYAEYKVRKYGAHGTSHQYVAQRTAQLMNKDIKDLKIVTCHLGQGSSICAVEGRKKY